MSPVILVSVLGSGEALKRIGYLCSCMTCLRGLIFCHFPQFQSPQISQSSVPLHVVCSAWKGDFFSTGQLLLTLSSSGQMSPLPGSLYWCISPGLLDPLCGPQLCCASITVLNAAVASKCIHCFPFLFFPTGLRVFESRNCVSLISEFPVPRRGLNSESSLNKYKWSTFSVIGTVYLLFNGEHGHEL